MGQLAAEVDDERCPDLVACAFPGAAVRAIRAIESRGAHSNVVVEVADRGTFVLRRYGTDAALCAKEAALLRTPGAAAAPVLVYADHVGAFGEPFLLYRFVEGVTFRELRDAASAADVARAAAAIGAALVRVGRDGASAACDLAPRPAFGVRDCADPLLVQRLPARDRTLLASLVEDWGERLTAVFAERALVHGDLNHRNVVVRRDETGTWEVAAILDWELASSGSPLWDAARFICYEKPHAPVCEPHFSAGFAAGGGALPPDWPPFSLVLNTVAAASALRDAQLRAEFVPELIELVAANLRRLGDSRFVDDR
jgi:aminoglycoside phosphotransferase (APT) family kinase protein